MISTETGHMAMQTCQINLTDTVPLALESTHLGLYQGNGKYLGASNLSTPIFSIPADIAVISLLQRTPNYDIKGYSMTVTAALYSLNNDIFHRKYIYCRTPCIFVPENRP